MTTDIARRDLGAEKDFAVALAQSDLLPRAYQKKPANVLVALEWAHALDVAPMVAMQQLAIIDGKPTASAQMIAGLVRRAGHQLRVHGDDTKATCSIVRSDDPGFTFESVWTIDRAKQAGLAGKNTWKLYPAAMLKARAITEAARDACPEALLGVSYTPEELGAEDRPPRDMAPAPVADQDGVIVEAELVDDSHPDLGEPTKPVTRAHPTPADDDPYRAPLTQTPNADPVHPSERPDVGAPSGTNLATDKSRKLMWALLRKTGMTPDQIRDWVAVVLERDNDWHTDTLTQFEVSTIIDRLKAEGELA